MYLPRRHSLDLEVEEVDFDPFMWQRDKAVVTAEVVCVILWVVRRSERAIFGEVRATSDGDITVWNSNVTLLERCYYKLYLSH